MRWAVEYALEKEVWIPVIAESELALYRSRDPDNVSVKAVALLRHGFGGHPLHTKSRPNYESQTGGQATMTVPEDIYLKKLTARLPHWSAEG